VVKATGFTNYMHIVREIATFARGAGIRMGVRGSAAASLILYTLGVTDIDPLAQSGVRALPQQGRPEPRTSTLTSRRPARGPAFAHRYGADRVAQIITFGTMGAKASIRDVGRLAWATRMSTAWHD
jgi:DNA polymerase-3 subunit alpha